MKKDASTPDMFSVSAPAKKEKTKAEPKQPHGMKVAIAGGCIAGLPQALAMVESGIRDAMRRCERATGMAGILTQLQAKRVTGIRDEIAAWIPELRRIQTDAANMVVERIPKASDLF